MVLLERRLAGRLRLWIPYGDGTNRRWLKDRLGDRIRPEWVQGRPGHWEIARAQLVPLLEALVTRFGQVEVLLEFSRTQKCDKRCRDATGDECVCSCLGRFHGGIWGRRWFEVGETTLARRLRSFQKARSVPRTPFGATLLRTLVVSQCT
jgi:hypothetical protein